MSMRIKDKNSVFYFKGEPTVPFKKSIQLYTEVDEQNENSLSFYEFLSFC